MHSSLKSSVFTSIFLFFLWNIFFNFVFFFFFFFFFFQTVLTEVQEAYDRELLFQANEGFIILVQALIRGYLTRKAFNDRLAYIKSQIPAIKKIQVIINKFVIISKLVNHHHHIALVARISLTLSRHSSLSFIALGRSSGQHPVSSHSCWMYVRAGRPAFARPCVGVHKSTSLMSSSLLLQQCPACLARLTWVVFVIGGRWPYSWCLVGCCRQDLFKIAWSILV